MARSGEPTWRASAGGASGCGRQGVELSHRLAANRQIVPLCFVSVNWVARRRILPGEARESPRNPLTSGSVQPRARAHLHTRAHSCTPVYPCTSPVSRTLHPSHTPQAGSLISYTPTTQAHSGIHGAAPHATRDPGG